MTDTNKPNLVVYNLNPDEVRFIRVSESDITTEDLEKIQNTYMNGDELTDEQETIHLKLTALPKLGKESMEAITFNRVFHAGFIL